MNYAHKINNLRFVGACLRASASLWSTMLASPPDWLCVVLVRTVGVEPTLPYGKRILSPQRLPFRHVRISSRGDGSAAPAYSAVISPKFSRSRISLPGLK